MNSTVEGYLALFRALLKQKGSQLILGVALIWSLTSTVDKVGIQNAAPTFWAAANYSFITLAMLPITLWKARSQLQQSPANLFSLVPLGLSTSYFCKYPGFVFVVGAAKPPPQ